jgi:hypothetical protein
MTPAESAVKKFSCNKNKTTNLIEDKAYLISNWFINSTRHNIGLYQTSKTKHLL